jgi:hypothetical protein
MSVGVMKDEKLNLRDLQVSYTLTGLHGELEHLKISNMTVVTCFIYSGGISFLTVLVLEVIYLGQGPLSLDILQSSQVTCVYLTVIVTIKICRLVRSSQRWGVDSLFELMCVYIPEFQQLMCV